MRVESKDGVSMGKSSRCVRKRGLAEALRLVHVGAWELDVKTEQFRCSEETYRILGLEPGSLLRPELLLSVVHPDDRKSARSSYGRCFSGDSTDEFVHRIVRPDGEVRFVRWTARVLSDRAGNPVRVVGAVQDITAQKAAELQLEQERQFSNAIVDTAGALIVVLDREGRVVRFNKACERVTGFRADQVLGRALWDVLVPPEEVEGVKRVFGELAGETDDSRHENHWLTASGERRLIVWSNTRVCDPDGRARWIIGTGMDVTEQRALERQLRRAARLEAVGQLAGGIAHDFNNLLTAIIGYLDLDLPEVPEDSRLHADLMDVRKAALRASELTQQLLAFSRQEAGYTETLDLNEAVKNVSKMLERLIHEDIHVELRIASDELPVVADRSQLEQVIVNLAVNARDAMPDGGVLSIETARADFGQDYAFSHPDIGEGAYAMVAVTDSGSGISPEVQERMYDPFFTTKSPERGTGLGLSMVYSTVRQHGGTIQCYSEVGVGTTFRVYLPLAGGEQARDKDPTGFSLEWSGRETVLVAEDDDAVRSMVERVLGELGYRVLLARDGDEALAMAVTADANVDLLLTDVVMPNISGPDLAARLRTVRPGVKVLYVSGYAGDRANSDGAIRLDAPILRKPFTANLLARAVRQTLDEKR